MGKAMLNESGIRKDQAGHGKGIGKNWDLN